jgi:cytochrome c553
MNRDYARWTFDIAAWITGLAFSIFLVADAVAGERQSAPATNPKWQAECGSCHIAYPPRMLSAPAWRTIMQGLDRHFGVDASLDAPTAAAIGAFLDANAQRTDGKRFDPAATRITESRWFRREHEEIGAAVWQRASVRSAANCGACHAQADRGVFGERDVRIPRS